MMHRLHFLIAWFVAASSCLGSLSFETTQLDLHLSNQETNASVVFPFTNTGKAKVEIKSVKTSCVCTAASSEKLTYAPGERGKVIVQYKPKDKPTTAQKDILVETNDPDMPIKALKLRIFVPEITPHESSSISWNLNEPPNPKFFRIRINEMGGMDISSVRSSDPAMSCKVGIIVPHQEYEISVTPCITSHPMKVPLIITANQNGNLKFIFITASVGQPQ